MKKSIHYIILSTAIIIFSAMLSSCKKFLEDAPSKTTSLVVSTTEHLDALLNFYTFFYQEENQTAIYSTDDYGLSKELFDARPGIFPMARIQYTLWDIPYIPDAGARIWEGEYKKIFTANLVLDKLDKVIGTDQEKAILKADAHFIRAYSHWVLANTYCLPYTDANKNEPGLPIKLSTSFEEPFARQPLFKVYEQIESDLTEALRTTVTLQSAESKKWRASKAAVNGFAARYYLNRFNYQKAIEHANAAMAEYNVLVDYNTEMSFGNPQSITLNSGTPQQSSFTIQYPYTHNNQDDFIDMFKWKELLYFRFLINESNWFIPSKELLSLYDEPNDLRFKYHIVEGYSYSMSMANPSYDYPGYVFFYKNKIPSGPTVAEMLLIKAEALARTNDLGGAMTALNTLRAKRMLPGSWVNLTASDKNDAIKKVIDERRREMPFVQRWFDIRRYNNNEDPDDDVTLTKTFYPYTNATVLNMQPVQTYTLPKNSRRYATPIPRTEIISSNGVNEQNNY